MLWLLSDERNDAGIAEAFANLPEASGFVFRHYHLRGKKRHTHFTYLATLARLHRHRIVLSGDIETAREWGADGVYGPAALQRAPGLLRLATAHDGAELQAANAAGVDGVFLSPVFPTRSHPGAYALGPMGFAVLAQQSLAPVIALGGMTAERAQLLGWPRWGAIDGLAAGLRAQPRT
ncbi:thiamine phosphate synthase [Alteriqipengyuania flavescens]|uniref:thiamine phosphate synthase n=1 Tax=Alteriqipengyuania flavescens TaxID=3053610 RepID=UPI0025B3C5A7|nr:thiamine phosphate synthase [Alteriqipengyuania flavescens]WJY19360.1 thiamine phosphate synthase [Alteriqipengyuania flavescens]WJY25302.1 thiamine phosphate synthase [Alteriqipengyuania flavescens]